MAQVRIYLLSLQTTLPEVLRRIYEQPEGANMELCLVGNGSGEEDLQWKENLAASVRALPPGIIIAYSRAARLLIEAVPTSSHHYLLLGFPFHRHKNPDDAHGWRALQSLSAQTTILQGEFDSHGARPLPSKVSKFPGTTHMHWLRGLNHRFVAAKGQTNAINFEQEIRKHITIIGETFFP